MSGAVMNAPDPVAEEDLARADLYRLLALLLEGPPDADLLDRLAAIPVAEGTLAAALADLASAARDTAPDEARAEYSALFVGTPMAKVMPYRGHYTDGQIFGRSLAALRGELAGLGVARSDDTSEPEDHVAVLCEIMSGLIVGAFGTEPMPLPAQKAFFERHIAPWIGQVFDALDAADEARFYRSVSRLGRTFAATETEAFGLL